MKKLTSLALALHLTLAASALHAQQPLPPQTGPARPVSGDSTIQDGIEVRRMSPMRILSSKDRMEQESAQQYTALLGQAQQKGALVPANHRQVIRLRSIAKRIIPHATRWNPEAARWNWQVNLLASEQVNAFCMAGGRIGFFSGILTTLRLTDDEVAAIMGHEIAHALREHGREQAGKATATNVIGRVIGLGAAALLGIDPSITDVAARVTVQGFALKFSRDDEREADLIGLDLAARAGFDPRAGIALWQKMGSMNSRQPLAFLSTHPGGTERINKMNQHMNVLLPLYARAKGVPVSQLPQYRTTALK